MRLRIEALEQTVKRIEKMTATKVTLPLRPTRRTVQIRVLAPSDPHTKKKELERTSKHRNSVTTIARKEGHVLGGLTYQVILGL